MKAQKKRLNEISGSQVALDQGELGSLLIYAARYALGRSSYAVGEVAEMIMKHGDQLNRGNLEVLFRDVIETQEDWFKTEARSQGNVKQHSCDRDTLAELRSWLEERLAHS